MFRVGGVGADVAFRDESGGHRWQRIPPNEKRGRVHTSTITVAVLPDPTEVQLRINPNELEFQTCRGSGPGGQHRNKTESAVQLTYLPTGLQVRVEDGRSQHHNRQIALELLRSRLWAAEQEKAVGARQDARKRQVGSGMRGDKRRTIRAQDGQVNDHVTGKAWRYKDYIRGLWD